MRGYITRSKSDSYATVLLEREPNVNDEIWVEGWILPCRIIHKDSEAIVCHWEFSSHSTQVTYRYKVGDTV